MALAAQASVAMGELGSHCVRDDGKDEAGVKAPDQPELPRLTVMKRSESRDCFGDRVNRGDRRGVSGLLVVERVGAGGSERFNLTRCYL